MDSARIIAVFRQVIACCSGKRKQKQALQISSPVDVRRVDICMPGLSEDYQAFIREKAAADAKRMFAGEPPSPLNSPLPHQHPRMKRVWEHTRKLSASLPYGYRSLHNSAGREGNDGSTVMLRDQNRGGFEEQGVEGGL